MSPKQQELALLAGWMCVRVCESVCAPFCALVGCPVTVSSSGFSHIWHSDGWAPGHTQTVLHQRARFNPVFPAEAHAGFVKFLSWHTNTIALSSCTWFQIPFIPLIYWPHIIQLAKMAFSPPCTVTSSAMFEKKKKKQPPNHSPLQILTFSHILLMFFFFSSPAVFRPSSYPLFFKRR